MSWVIVILIAIFANVIVFATCGAGGGLMMLVALNGFSESAATPFLAGYGAMVLVISWGISTGATWMYVKPRSAASGIGFWHAAGVNAGVIVLMILGIVAFMAIRAL